MQGCRPSMSQALSRCPLHDACEASAERHCPAGSFNADIGAWDTSRSHLHVEHVLVVVDFITHECLNYVLFLAAFMMLCRFSCACRWSLTFVGHRQHNSLRKFSRGGAGDREPQGASRTTSALRIGASAAQVVSDMVVVRRRSST